MALGYEYLGHLGCVTDCTLHLVWFWVNLIYEYNPIAFNMNAL
jgi:hypothetical protein